MRGLQLEPAQIGQGVYAVLPPSLARSLIGGGTSLNSSDWITIIATLLAVLVGGGISWVFFRTQLLIDIRSIRELVNALAARSDVKHELQQSRKLAALEKQLALIHGNVKTSVAAVEAALHKQRILLIRDIQRQLELETERARSHFDKLLEGVLARAGMDAQERCALIEGLQRAFVDSLRIVGDLDRAQSMALVKHDSSILNELLGTLDEARSELAELKAQVGDLATEEALFFANRTAEKWSQPEPDSKTSLLAKVAAQSRKRQPGRTQAELPGKDLKSKPNEGE